MIENDIKSRFLFRIRAKFSNEIDALPIPNDKNDIIDAVVDLDGEITLCIIRFYLQSGIVETLATNDFSTDKALFKKLYFMRWPIEQNYDLIKNKIGLTDFVGYSENSILQEFWIAILLSNLTNVVQKEIDGILKGDEVQKPSSKKHHYKTNTNELFGCISRRIADYFDTDSIRGKYSILRDIFNFGLSHKVVDRKGSGLSNPRNIPRAVKHHWSRKRTH